MFRRYWKGILLMMMSVLVLAACSDKQSSADNKGEQSDEKVVLTALHGDGKNRGDSHDWRLCILLGGVKGSRLGGEIYG